MSVNIEPEDNCRFCEKHGTVQYETYSCMCADFGPEAMKECLECKGTGEVKFPKYPHSVNLSNGNWHTLHSALALPGDSCCGSVEADFLITQIRSTPAELGVRAGSDSQEPGKARVISLGIDESYVETRFIALFAIANEAKRRKVLVTWG